MTDRAPGRAHRSAPGRPRAAAAASSRGHGDAKVRASSAACTAAAMPVRWSTAISAAKARAIRAATRSLVRARLGEQGIDHGAGRGRRPSTTIKAWTLSQRASNERSLVEGLVEALLRPSRQCSTSWPRCDALCAWRAASACASRTNADSWAPAQCGATPGRRRGARLQVRGDSAGAGTGRSAAAPRRGSFPTSGRGRTRRRGRSVRPRARATARRGRADAAEHGRRQLGREVAPASAAGRASLQRRRDSCLRRRSPRAPTRRRRGSCAGALPRSEQHQALQGLEHEQRIAAAVAPQRRGEAGGIEASGSAERGDEFGHRRRVERTAARLLGGRAPRARRAAGGGAPAPAGRCRAPAQRREASDRINDGRRLDRRRRRSAGRRDAAPSLASPRPRAEKPRGRDAAAGVAPRRRAPPLAESGRSRAISRPRLR